MKSMLLKTLLSCVAQPGRFLYSARTKGESSQLPEEGLTLLECVVAIAVIALTGAMIGPPLVMAAATRVQNRRAEQAQQLAQGEVDRIRAMVVQGNATAELLPKLVEESVTNLEAQGAPDTFLADNTYLRSPNTTCNKYDTTKVAAINEALPVDVNGPDADGNCEADFYIQAFRGNLDPTGNNQDFQLMVRVYSAQAKDQETLGVEPAGLSFTSGNGEYWTKPLAVLSTIKNLLGAIGMISSTPTISYPPTVVSS
ncbi:MAG: type II secretion system protein, partial [Merismopedia sp. SIO2A8]|nr:type II secretion system protein [Merismopedia sp. SIO2A8]